MEKVYWFTNEEIDHAIRERFNLVYITMDFEIFFEEGVHFVGQKGSWKVFQMDANMFRLKIE